MESAYAAAVEAFQMAEDCRNVANGGKEDSTSTIVGFARNGRNRRWTREVDDHVFQGVEQAAARVGYSNGDGGGHE